MAAIRGLQKTTLIDFPPYIACTLFISTCNFRCGFCYNPDLVNDAISLPSFTEEEILAFLEKRKNLLDGVCITGGEPTLYMNLNNFIKKIKEKGYKVKLDTNGSNPSMLKELIDEKLVDYVAMDIKSSKEKYSKAAGVNVDLGKIQESIDTIKKSGIDYEFRTTTLPDFFTKEDAVAIGKWLNSSKKYCLQQFHRKQATLDPQFMKKKSYDIKELDEIKKIMEPHFNEVILRT